MKNYLQQEEDFQGAKINDGAQSIYNALSNYQTDKDGQPILKQDNCDNRLIIINANNPFKQFFTPTFKDAAKITNVGFVKAGIS